MIDPNSINIDSLSVEEIDALLPQLQKELEEVRKAEDVAAEAAIQNKPIYERVREQFSSVWGEIQHSLTERHEQNLQREEKIFVLDEGMRIALEHTIGESNSKIFFKALRECIRDRDFKSNCGFYRKVKDRDVAQAAKVAFAVYRLNRSKIVDSEYLGSKWIKGKIPGMLNSDTPMVRTLVSDLREIGFIPS